MWEPLMQYLCDNLNLHTIHGGELQYPHYDPKPHYILEREMQYLHNNLKMCIIYKGKMQYSHYDLNPHCMWKL
jgi:hypothetical protein